MRRKKLGVLALIGALISSAIFMTGCNNAKESSTEKKVEKESQAESKKESESEYNLEETVVSIDDKNITMKEMMYYIYQSEQEGNYYESLFQSMEGSDEGFWETEFQEGKTNREVLKDETMNSCILYAIFEEKAKEEGYALTESDKETARSDAEELYNILTDKQKKVMGLSVEDIAKLQEKILLGNKYYEKVLKGIHIDEDAIRASVDKETYRQYDVDYIYIPTVTYDDEYNPVELSKEEKEEAYQKIEKLLPKAIKGRNFDKLIGDEESQLESGSIGFIKGDNIYGEEFEKVALSLKNGEVAKKIVEGEDGYYIVKMVNDNSTDNYESEVENAKNDAKNKEFEKQFTEMKKDYKIEINASVWDTVTLGQITYDQEAQQNME